MLPGDRYPPDDPREWLNRARSSLRLAGARLDGIYLEDLCVRAHDAAGKAIKAVLLARTGRAQPTHDLERLLEVLAESGEAIPPQVRRAAYLTVYAVADRYPSADGVTEAEYVKAFASAHAVVEWAAKLLSGGHRLRERRLKKYPVDTRMVPARAPDAALLRAIVERTVAAAAPERIILFGSAARDALRPDSDIDLLVIKAGDFRRRELAVAIRRALRGLPSAFDIVVATPADIDYFGHSPALVYHTALREGRVLFAAAPPS